MAILIVFSDGCGGSGDAIFAAQTAQRLETELSKKGYRGDFYILSLNRGIQLIHSLNSDNRFNIKKIHYIQEVDDTSKEITIGEDKTSGIKAISIPLFVTKVLPSIEIEYLILGPTVFPRLRFPVPEYVPILFLTEYSLDDENLLKLFDYNMKFFNDWERDQLDLIHTGLDLEKKEAGIFTHPELHQVLLQKDKGDFSFREKYWDRLSKSGITEYLLKGHGIEEYHKKTQLSFEYTHDQDWRESSRSNSCQYFLYLHQLITSSSGLHQDVIAIGDEHSKYEAIKSALRVIIENGYNKIIYINFESTAEPIVLYDDGKSEKIFRLIRVNQLSHAQMIALQALSDYLVYVTGDQSFAESVGKLIGYEQLAHKEKLVNGFIETLFQVKKNLRVKELAILLLQEDLSPNPANEGRRKQFVELISDHKLVREFKLDCAEALSQFDCGSAIVKKVMPLITEDQSYAYFEHHIRLAIAQNNNKKFAQLLECKDIDFLQQDRNGLTILTYALSHLQFDMFKKLISRLRQDSAARKEDFSILLSNLIANSTFNVYSAMRKTYLKQYPQARSTDFYNEVLFCNHSPYLKIYDDLLIDQQLRAAIDENKAAHFGKIINTFSIDLLVKNSNKMTVLAYAIENKRADIVQAIINYMISNHLDLFSAFYIEDKNGITAYELLNRYSFLYSLEIKEFFSLEYIRYDYDYLIRIPQFDQIHPQWREILKTVNQLIYQSTLEATKKPQVMKGLLLLFKASLDHERKHSTESNKRIKTVFSAQGLDTVTAAEKKTCYSFLKEFIELHPNLFENESLIYYFNRLSGLKITPKPVEDWIQSDDESENSKNAKSEEDDKQSLPSAHSDDLELQPESTASSSTSSLTSSSLMSQSFLTTSSYSRSSSSSSSSFSLKR